MNRVGRHTVEKLRFCFDNKIGIRPAARVAMCNRKTAARFYEAFKAGREIDCDELRGLKESVDAKVRRKLAAESSAREMTTAALCTLILETCARDGLFSAILDK